MGRILLLLLLSTAICGAQTRPIDFASRVNPMIGTGGHGHTYPGALMPFGMMQLSPDTRLDGWDGCSGYHYSDTVIYGFSHTHLSGTGCSDYGDILLMPATNPDNLDSYGSASSFSHKNEKTTPGYYSVFLDKPQVKVELTTTTRCGMHRCSFRKEGPEWLVINLKHRDEVLDSKLEIVDSVTLRGYRFSKAWASNQKVFFEIKFSVPFQASVVNPVRSGAIRGDSAAMRRKNIVRAFQFKNDGRPLVVKVAISAVSEEGAHKNMQAEMPDWNFDDYRKKAHAAWNKELSKIDAKGGTADQKTIFYTALYHSMSAPNIYSDIDNRYRGRDDKIHSTGGKFDYYTVFSLWDTYRAEHPLLTLIDPKRTNDFINTFLAEYEQGGELPVWELSSNETYCMIGYHSVPVIWDAYSKGIRGFNAEKAYEAMKHSAMMDHFGLASYKKYGYVRADDESESVSKTLEYAYDDWCIAQMAAALGKDSDQSYFERRSQSWRNVFDPTTGFMRARKNGTLYEPFSPYAVDGNYTEANAWQYSFYVPHDVDGLIKAMGGKEKFEAKLDALFTAKIETEGREQADITGLIGQYAHGNEPSHHIAYLYNFVNKPEKSRAIIKHVIDSFYRNAPDGLIGNEDCGQMSAWYVMSAMGIYSVCPGNGPNYERGITMFDKILITPKPGQTYDLSKLENERRWSQTNHLVHASDSEYGTKFPVGVYDGARDVRYMFGDSRYHLPTPYIIGAKGIFTDSQQIKLACLIPDSLNEVTIFYSLNGAPAVQYYMPFTIFTNTALDFYSKNYPVTIDDDDTGISPIQTAIFTRLPDDRSIILHSTYNKGYSAGGPEALIDGQHGTTNWRTGGWQGYQGQDFEGIVALKGPARKVSSIKATFLEDQNAWIFYPAAVSFYASDDSLHWQLIEVIPTHKSDHNTEVTTCTFATQKPVTARYIKVVAKTFGKMPDWHEGRGEPSFIFIDEIEVK